MSGSSTYLVFSLGELTAAFGLGDVREVLALPAMKQPPGLPAVLAGFVRLGNEILPVVNLAQLLQLPPQAPSIDQHLILLRHAPMLCLVDRVLELCPLPAPNPVPTGQTFNDTVVGLLDYQGDSVSLLDSDRLLLETEQARIQDFQHLYAQRLQNLEAP